MHILFGVNENTCEGCRYLVREYGHLHCLKWGEHSEWSANFTACGLRESKNETEQVRKEDLSAPSAVRTHHKLGSYKRVRKHTLSVNYL